MLGTAIVLATEAHRNQKDKAGEPYILHPLRIMGQLKSEESKIVGVLHDVVEDTSYTLDDLRHAGFGETIINAIESVTKKKGESYEAFIRRARTNPIGCKVKIADLKDNLNLGRLRKVAKEDLERVAKYGRALEVLAG